MLLFLDPRMKMSSAKPSTSMHLSGDRAEFWVGTADPTYRQQLDAMGFQRKGDDVFVRYVSASSDIERIFENFDRHLEEMLLQHASLRSVHWEPALAEFIARLDHSGVTWWLVGSGALAVRGLDVAPRDLDFAVSDARAVGALLDDRLVEPVTHMEDWAAEWFGRGFLHVIVEWVSDARPDSDQALEHGPAAADRLEVVEWGGHTVSVAPIDLQLEVAERRGQRERATAIRAFMKR